MEERYFQKVLFCKLIGSFSRSLLVSHFGPAEKAWLHVCIE